MGTYQNLDWTEILSKLQSLATSELARHTLAKTESLPDIESAQKSFAEIQAAQVVLESGRRCHMESLDHFSLWHQRLSKGAILKTIELKDVRHFCIEALALKETLLDFETPWLKNLCESLMDASEPLSAIDQLMTAEGDIRTDASEDLYKLYREKTQQIKTIQNSLDRLAKDNELESVLQDRYVTNREGRWVLPVKSGMQHHFDGIIHSASQTKQTVFMEPKEIIPLNNRLRQIEVEIEEEIERLLITLSKYLHNLVNDFFAARDILLKCDQRFAQGQLGILMSAVPTRFHEDEIHLNQIRHPLLAMQHPEVVANSVTLDRRRRILLLSGPNAGGKTVLLKAIGLAAQMARCGLLIAADEGSTLPFFKDVFVAVGDAQSVDAHLSTFAAHLSILNRSTKVSGSQNLLLIDEICGSTDPEEGSALARSFIETYAQQGVFAVITSHLGPLKLGWKPDSGVINGSLEYDQSTGRPTYQFLMGVPGQSLAIQTARRVGVSQEIVERAMEHLTPEMRGYQMGLAEIDSAKAELHQLKTELNKQLSLAKKEKAKFHALSQKFEKEREAMMSQAVRRAEKKIDELIEHTKVDEVFKRHEKLTQSKFQLPDIIKPITKTQGKETKIDSAESFAKAFPPGTKVYALPIQKDGVVQSLPNNRGEVLILANSMRLSLPWEQLKPPQTGGNPALQAIKQSTGLGTSGPDTDRVVDLRGLSLEEATQMLEAQLDTAQLREEDRVKVVHGHGTETLKRGIRSYLSRSVYVKKWRVGTSETGGDGVTWVELKD